MSDIHEDFAAYTEPRWQMLCSTRNPNDPSGNSVMFTCEKMQVLGDEDAVRDEDLSNWYAMLEACSRKPGWTMRTPPQNENWNDPERWDNVMAIAATAREFASPASTTILSFLNSRTYQPLPWLPWPRFKGYYPSAPYWRKNDTQCWFFRSPSIRAHFEFAAWQTPALWRQAIWALSVAYCGILTPKAQDPWRITEHMVRAARGMGGKLVAWAIGKRQKRLLATWGPDGMKAVRGAYFGDNQHPLAVWG